MTEVLLGVITTAMLLVRFGWAGRRGVAVAGWVVAVIALMTLAVRDGAWGLAIGTVTGMAVALAAVLHAGWRSPTKVRQAPREALSVTIPRRWSDLTRRIAIFVLAVPVGFASAQWLALGTQALARREGVGEADAIVLSLFLQPMLWSVIMAVQMTRVDARWMIAPPAAAAVLGTLLWTAS